MSFFLFLFSLLLFLFLFLLILFFLSFYFLFFSLLLFFINNLNSSWWLFNDCLLILSNIKSNLFGLSINLKLILVSKHDGLSFHDKIADKHSLVLGAFLKSLLVLWELELVFIELIESLVGNVIHSYIEDLIWVGRAFENFLQRHVSYIDNLFILRLWRSIWFLTWVLVFLSIVLWLIIFLSLVLVLSLVLILLILIFILFVLVAFGLR